MTWGHGPNGLAAGATLSLFVCVTQTQEEEKIPSKMSCLDSGRLSLSFSKMNVTWVIYDFLSDEL